MWGLESSSSYVIYNETLNVKRTKREYTPVVLTERLNSTVVAQYSSWGLSCSRQLYPHQ